MSCCVGMCCTESSWLGVHRMLRNAELWFNEMCKAKQLNNPQVSKQLKPKYIKVKISGQKPQDKKSPSLRSVRCTPSQLLSVQHIPTQHDMLPQHLVCKKELNCEYCNITLARNNKAP